MKYPSGERYNEAVQNPNVYFLDPEVKQKLLQTDGLGLPEVLSGGFAFTYKFNGPAGDIAVRCFHKEIPDLFERYRAISKFLSSLNSNFFVEFAFEEKGLLIDGTSLPLVRMEWIEGDTLLGYVSRNKLQRPLLADLRAQLLSFSDEAEARGYAHGDVQHRNLMVDSRSLLKLVDYDGMYVPALRHLKAADGGQPNFQPPSRSERDFGPRMDRFPLAVIDFSLEVLEEAPELFDEFHRGENLILTQRDFLEPANSPILNRIACLPKMASRVTAFSDICGLAVNEMPSLREFREVCSPGSSRTASQPVKDSIFPETYSSTFDVVDGMSFRAAVKYVGRPIELIGRVVRIKELKGQNLVALRFGERYTDTPAVVMPLPVFKVWSGAARLKEQPWVSASGVLQRHKSGKYSTIQVLAKDASDVELLSNKSEADFRLGRTARRRSTPRPLAGANPSILAPSSSPKSWKITRSNPGSKSTWIEDQQSSVGQVPASANTQVRPQPASSKSASTKHQPISSTSAASTNSNNPARNSLGAKPDALSATTEALANLSDARQHPSSMFSRLIKLLFG